MTPSGHRLHVVGIVYRVTVTGGELRDEPDGSTDHAEWIPFDRLDALPLGRGRPVGPRLGGALTVRSTIGIDVGAPPDLVYRLARDVTRWERLLPHYARSRVVRREADGALVCDFVARRVIVPWLGAGVPVAWRSRTWHEPATRRLRFHHVAGATKGMDVTWTIEPAGDGTRVEIEHDFRPRVPGFAAFVDRAFTRPIAGRTLATMRALAEALSGDAALSGEARRAGHG